MIERGSLSAIEYLIKHWSDKLPGLTGRAVDDTYVVTAPCQIGGEPHKLIINGFELLRYGVRERFDAWWEKINSHDRCQIELGPAGRA